MYVYLNSPAATAAAEVFWLEFVAGIFLIRHYGLRLDDNNSKKKKYPNHPTWFRRRVKPHIHTRARPVLLFRRNYPIFFYIPKEPNDEKFSSDPVCKTVGCGERGVHGWEGRRRWRPSTVIDSWLLRLLYFLLAISCHPIANVCQRSLDCFEWEEAELEEEKQKRQRLWHRVTLGVLLVPDWLKGVRIGGSSGLGRTRAWISLDVVRCRYVLFLITDAFFPLMHERLISCVFFVRRPFPFLPP